MKKYVLLSAMLVALAAPGAAWSQGVPPGGNNGAPPPQGSGGQGQYRDGDGQRFQERKSEMLQRMNEHLADVQKRISCVQAAKDRDDLRACMPRRGRMMRRGGMMQNDGGNQGAAPQGGATR